MVQPLGASESSDPPASEDPPKATAEAPPAKEAPPATEAAPHKEAPPPKKAPPPTKPPPSKGYAHLFKYVVIGDSWAGKTALIRRFSKDSFEESRDYTIGVDFDIKTMSLPNGDEVKLQLWDTAGQERYRTITTSYYRGSHAIIIVYDVNDKESFDNVLRWMEEAQRYCNDDALTIVVGCKTDLKNEAKGFYGKDRLKEVLENAQLVENVLGVYEASAKTGEGVQQAFGALTEELVNRRLNERNPLRRGGKVISLSKGQEGNQSGKKPKGKCC